MYIVFDWCRRDFLARFEMHWPGQMTWRLRQTSWNAVEAVEFNLKSFEQREAVELTAPQPQNDQWKQI
jgi:hypothetical protein